MTAIQPMLQLLFLGVLLVSPAYLQQQPCDIVRNTITRGSFKLEVDPPYYKPGAEYTVSLTGIENGTSVILQASSFESNSGGLWESENRQLSCSGVENLVQKNISGNGTQTRWISPTDTHVTSVLIRAFVTFVNGTTLLQSRSLGRDLRTAVVASTPPSNSSLPATSSHKPTVHSNSANSHTLLNSSVAHHNFASSHQWTKGPPSSVSVAQASSFLLAAMQFLSVSLGYKLLS